MFKISSSQNSSILHYRKMKEAFENRILAVGWLFFAGYGVAMLAFAHEGWMFGSIVA